MHAIRPRYCNKRKSYVIDVATNPNPLLAHNGYFVYDDPVTALKKVKGGWLLSKWTVQKQQAVCDYLVNQISDPKYNSETPVS